MKNKTYMIIFTAFCLLPAITMAQPKFDGSNTAASTTEGITVGGEAAGKTTDTAVKGKKSLTFLDKVKKKYEIWKARAENIKKTVAAGTQAYEGAMNVKDSAMDYYESEKDNIAGQFSATDVSAATTAKQLAEIELKLSQRKNVLTTENDAKAAEAQANVSILETMYANTDDESSRKEIFSALESAKNELNGYTQNQKGDSWLNDDVEYSDLLNQKKQLEQKALEFVQDKGMDLAKKGLSLLKKDNAEKEREYNKVIESCFLKDGEPVDDDTIKPIMAYRRTELIKQIGLALDAAEQQIRGIKDRKEQIELIAQNTSGVDLEASAVSLLIDLRIEELNLLFDYTNLLLADIRLKTARNMLNQDYRLRNYDKNPAVMNLDNYVFTEADVTGEKKKSFWEKAADTAQQVVDTAKQATEKAKEVKESVDENKDNE